jgi:hypothetical protein
MSSRDAIPTTLEGIAHSISNIGVLSTLLLCVHGVMGKPCSLSLIILIHIRQVPWLVFIVAVPVISVWGCFGQRYISLPAKLHA